VRVTGLGDTSTHGIREDGAVEEKRSIQSIARAMRVLEALNRAGVVQVEQLHRDTKLPKSTLIRILETLTACGYVFQVSRKAGYALTERALRLSAGVRDRDALTSVARPFMDSFTLEHKWQISLGTYDAGSIMVRYSTRRFSPFAPEKTLVGGRTSMVLSALGRAYLAYCTPEEVDCILGQMTRSEDVGAREMYGAPTIHKMLENVRHTGYAIAERQSDDPIRSFAVPITHEAEPVLGSVSLFYYRSTMTEEQATQKYLTHLKTMATDISRVLRSDAGAMCLADPVQIAQRAQAPAAIAAKADRSSQRPRVEA